MTMRAIFPGIWVRPHCPGDVANVLAALPTKDEFYTEREEYFAEMKEETVQ